MDNKTAWQSVSETLKVNITPLNYSAWFSKTFLVSLQEKNQCCIAEIGCPSSFAREQIAKNYHQILTQAFETALGKKTEVILLVKQSPENTSRLQPENGLFSPSFSPQDEFINLLRRTHLRPEFSFNNFAVSSSNQMAWAAASAVAKNPGTAYNPLFIYGGVGLGKTHLMQAIGQDILKKNSSARIIYCAGEEFTNEIVDAIRNKTANRFKEKYRSAHALLLDDIQFIAGKDRVQEEFFHTFNVIQREGGQVVLTSDRPPSEIKLLEDRLRSRFEAGLTVDVPPPDHELRTAILLIKAKQKNIDLDIEIARLIAANFASPRQIEGFLTRLISESQIKQIALDNNLVQRLLGKPDLTPALPRILPQNIIETVATYFSLGPRQLTGNRRQKTIVNARQIAMYLLRTQYQLSLDEVGHLLGDRDHTTVMHGVDKITNNLGTNLILQEDIQRINKILSG